MATPDRNLARRLDLTSLQLFMAASELGSIGRAAEHEYIAASAASKRIADLEDAVGAPLFYRRARGVELTPAGQTFLHHAKAVQFNLERMQADLNEYAQGVRGHVRVHANISAIVQFLPEDLAGFAQCHPEVKIDLSEHLSAEVVRAVREGDCDLGICHPPTATDDLALRPYRQDRLVLVVPEGHALARLPAVAFTDTLDYDHLGLHSNSSIYLAMSRAAHQAGRTVRLRMQVTGLDALCRMVQSGLGLGLVPDRAFGLLRRMGGLQAVALTDDWATRELQLVARDFATLPVTARLLATHLGSPPPAAS
ncbi:LysR family transcriptional regulator [Ramlibacter sp. AW1]|uniref:LysR family transcriptional regulator n=1 Tax=Ramlibacter aurantiacus TaxID=2801330 RepID=A0A936ZY47_9BURK|nr:LysR substrate-binding domain-containing protein [Ramlibacter aurantiacus]MBL0423210.1 LysR family transcriptional regulator [Ramlibacter aurantiacus]